MATFNASGTGLIYSTYLGGSGNDFTFALTADASGGEYVVGGTNSTDFPTVNAFQAKTAGESANTCDSDSCYTVDGFISKFDAGGRLVWASYLGSTALDEVVGVQAKGPRVYVESLTDSTHFPLLKLPPFSDSPIAVLSVISDPTR